MNISHYQSNLKSLLVLVLLMLPGFASATHQEQVESFYRIQISTINQTLKTNQSLFEQSPLELAAFVDNTLLPLWNSSKTLKGLFGKSHWQSLSEIERQQLMKGFDDTIQRYVQEGFALYDGQELEFVGLKFNKSSTKGILTIKVIPNLIPSFNVDFKIARVDKSWHLYDIYVQGISYISLKKDSFRKQLEEQGVIGVLGEIQAKNDGYIKSQPQQKLSTSD